MLDILGSLVEKSLVMLDEQDDSGRYRMLETIRDYAREKLEQQRRTGRDAAAALRALLCAGQARRATACVGQSRLSGFSGSRLIWTTCGARFRWRSRARRIRSSPSRWRRLACSFWMLRGYATEGRSIVRAALQLPAIPSQTWPRLGRFMLAPRLAESQSDHAEARRMLETCLVLRRRLGQSGRHCSHAFNPVAGETAGRRRRAGPATGEREALRIFRELGDRRGEAIGPAAPRADCHIGRRRRKARTHLEQMPRNCARDQGTRNSRASANCSLGELAFRSVATGGKAELVVQALFDRVP